MHPVAFVAFSGVRPISDINTAIRSSEQIDASEPVIVEENKIVCVTACVAGPIALEAIIVKPISVHVDHEDCVLVTVGPASTLIENQSIVRVPAAEVAAFGGIRA